MENSKKLWKRSWKVMEFEEPKRIRTVLNERLTHDQRFVSTGLMARCIFAVVSFEVCKEGLSRIYHRFIYSFSLSNALLGISSLLWFPRNFKKNFLSNPNRKWRSREANRLWKPGKLLLWNPKRKRWVWLEFSDKWSRKICGCAYFYVSVVFICGLSLLVLYSAPRGFLRVLRFPLSSKTSIWLDLC